MTPAPDVRAALSGVPDQSLVPTKVCALFRCQLWIDGKAISPELRVEDGDYVCPKCGNSYGAAALDAAREALGEKHG